MKCTQQSTYSIECDIKTIAIRFKCNYQPPISHTHQTLEERIWILLLFMKIEPQSEPSTNHHICHNNNNDTAVCSFCCSLNCCSQIGSKEHLFFSWQFSMPNSFFIVIKTLLLCVNSVCVRIFLEWGSFLDFLLLCHLVERTNGKCESQCNSIFNVFFLLCSRLYEFYVVFFPFKANIANESWVQNAAAFAFIFILLKNHFWPGLALYTYISIV